MGVALFGVVSTGRQGQGDPFAPLAVRLVGPPSPAEAPPVPAAPEVVVTTDASAVALPAPSDASSAEPRPARVADDVRVAVQPRPSANATAPSRGTVAVRENYGAMGGMSADLVTRAQSSYLIEVEKPVRVLSVPEVPYPPEALRAGRQDTVVAWIAIDREGAIEDVVIDSGEPEFAQAVLAALPKAKFLPAEERGEIIPFYIVLQFDFRTAGGANGAAADASTATPTAASPAN